MSVLVTPTGNSPLTSPMETTVASRRTAASAACSAGIAPEHSNARSNPPRALVAESATSTGSLSVPIA